MYTGIQSRGGGALPQGRSPAILPEAAVYAAPSSECSCRPQRSSMQNSPIKVTLEPTGLREKTTQVLREAILNLHFRPGQKLVERALCEGTGVSRTCIREALR